MITGKNQLRRLTSRLFRPTIEKLEDRTVPSTAWAGFAHDPQHTGVSTVASQALDAIHWQTPVDLNPTGATVHYGSPVITAANTIVIPVKTGTNGGFELVAHNGATGKTLWTHRTDYTLPPFDWMPPLGPTLTPSNRLYFAGNGGTVYYVNNPDAAGATISGQLAFYGIANYNANPTAYNSTVMIDTPITSDSAGNIYFGFEVTGSNPSNLVGGGIARIDAGGNGSWVLASNAASDANMTKAPQAAAPALSADGSILYASVNNNGNVGGYLLGLNSTTLATVYKVALMDPRNDNANPAQLLDDSTATPMVAPDGTVFYGIFGNPYNGSRGFMLHFSADLATEYTPGAFGWDDTASIVPTSMAASYHGKSPYLIFTKYNNYVAGETGSSGGDGVNKVAVLDPFATQPDTNNDSDPNLLVMNEVLTMVGPTPDANWINNGFPNAVREWCINDTVVDPFTKSILINSEDGNVYRWNLTTDTLTQSVALTQGIGEPYVPSLIGPDGTMFAINGGTLFAIGGLPNYRLSDAASVNPAPLGQAVTFSVALASTNKGAVPTGTVTWMDGSTVLATATLATGKASYTTSALTLANHFIVAAYSGDANYAAGSTTLVESVRNGSSTLGASSANPAVFGQPITLTATVSSTNQGTPTPTGKITFLDGSTLLGVVDLSSGQAALTISNLAVGTHSITMKYNGDINFVPSDSNVVTQNVNKDTTTSVVFSSANPSTLNQAVTFTVTVTANAPGSGVPGGTAYFLDGKTVLGNGQLNSAGQASFTTSSLSAGKHFIRATYKGSARYSASTSVVLIQTVNASAAAALANGNGSPANALVAIPTDRAMLTTSGDSVETLNLQALSQGPRSGPALSPARDVASLISSERGKESFFTLSLANLDAFFGGLAEAKLLG